MVVDGHGVETERAWVIEGAQPVYGRGLAIHVGKERRVQVMI